MSNRRNFLKILGTGMAAATANPVLAGVSRLKTDHRTLKIGLLSPQSNLFPAYPYSFINGFRLGIDQHQALRKKQIEIITEQVGYGTPFLSTQAARKLLYENNVDLMTGILGTEVVSQFSDLFQQKEVPFIVCNPGEYFPVEPLRKNPFLFFNTLNLYQSSFLQARYATTHYGKKGLIVTSLYDSGYDAVYAFTHGAEMEEGTTEVVILRQGTADTVSEALSRIRSTAPDYVYALLSGDLAREFILRFRNEENSSLPLMATPFVTEEHFLTTLGASAAGIETIAPWSRHLDHPASLDFVKNYRETTRSNPDMMAMLGYETGLLTYRALASCNGDFSGTSLAHALREARMTSPRGDFSFDPETGWAQTPMYLTSIRAGLFNLTPEPHPEVLPQSIAAHDLAFAALDTPLRSGWLNPYLFV
jgi:branched-chain amino acid transport system substrate-binding protein